jgi:hypothetical protein
VERQEARERRQDKNTGYGKKVKMKLQKKAGRLNLSPGLYG